MLERAVWAGLRKWLRMADALLFLLSPLAILMVVVALIMLLDGFSSQARFVSQFEQAGQLAAGLVREVDAPRQLVLVNFSAGGEERIGLLNTRFDPLGLDQLRPGQAVEILFLPPGLGDQVIRADAVETVRGYLGFATQPLILFAIGWVIVVLHPEFLYLGYIGMAGKKDEALL